MPDDNEGIKVTLGNRSILLWQLEKWFPVPAIRAEDIARRIRELREAQNEQE